MTSSVRFFGIKAMTIGAALSMTAGVAFAGDNTIPTSAIITSLKAPPVTRSLSGDPQALEKKQREITLINKVRNRPTRSLSMDERDQLQSLTIDKPKIDLEINFDYNSAAISRGSISAVQHLGEALTDQQLHGQTFIVSGYTDAVGGDAFNQDLSNRRADTIKKYLVDHYHIAASDLVTVGYGKTHLKDADHPDAGVNRRVQVVNSEAQSTAQQ
ncbi:MAG TPA: OmpA family protein [Bradyrhizobium sp.]|uniref:OmpA family protein n=1 Tax=Bradyrhizobium sp. TaxID=376 RepID=UPI002C6752BC|nr:OmpA family protein [Bradyrhizobium sp.]HLZ02823.1 OmpA family protein [Bradyrhizobium sp.]